MKTRTRDTMAGYYVGRANYWLCEMIAHQDGARHAPSKKSMQAYVFLARKARDNALAAYMRLWDTGSDCRSLEDVCE